MPTAHSEVDADRLARQSAWALGLGGLIPFWTAPFLGLIGDLWSLEAALLWQTWLVLYAAIIVSFMSGGRWAFCVLHPDTRTSSVFGGFLGAVSPALVAWLIAALPAGTGGLDLTVLKKLMLLAVLLIIQGFQDRAHARVGGVPPWYLKLRRVLIIGATTPLLLPPLLRAMSGLVAAWPA